MAPGRREFFPRVKKTVIPRPVVKPEFEVRGQSGSVRAAEATLSGPNWHHDRTNDLIEIWDAGAALCFKDVLPRKDLYAREGLYLRLAIAYRTTPGAFVNIRTLSGNNVTLLNAPNGAMYEDPCTRDWITDDCTININSVHRDERIWFQRVDWEWVSRQTVFQDELNDQGPYLLRTQKEVDALYADKTFDDTAVKEFLIEKIRGDSAFAKRCLVLLCEGALLRKDLATLHKMLNEVAK